MRNIYLIIFVLFLTLWIGCQRQARVANPAGWQVLAFEMTASGGSMQYLRVDANSFEIRGERQVRGETMRTTVRGNKQGRIIIVEWFDRAGHRRTDPPIQINDNGQSLQSLQANYYVGSVFPSSQTIRARLGSNLIATTYCGRQAYEVRRARQVDMIDAQTGIQLAVYRPSDRTVIWSLRSAKWMLRSRQGTVTYEIVCAP